MHLQFHHHGKQFFFFTACLQGRPQVLSTLVEGEKRPLLTPLGEAVKAVLIGTHGRNPALTMSDYVIMPDHVHFLLIADYDRDPTSAPITFMHEWRELAAPLVWERGYWISLAWYAEQRKAIRAYIRGNPARALWKRAHLDRFALHQRLRHASLDPALPWSGVGDLTLIASPFRFAVRLTRHREVAEQEAAIAEAVERAQRGMIPVCGFISPAERELQRRLRAEPTARWIKTVPHGLRPGYDPSLEDSRAIANGQLLILSSFPPDVPGDSITRANCELMNSRILALCGAAAEPIQTVGEGCLPGPLPNGREGAPSLNPAPFRGHGGSAPGLLGPFRRKP